MQWKIFHVFPLWKRRVLKLLSPSAAPEKASVTVTDNSLLSPPPRHLLANRVVYEIPLLNRGRIEPDGDTPLAALYRIYEHIVLDQHIEVRNEIEAFWYHADWAVRDLPDPRDPHPERYACLACIPALLCLAFNKRIELGLPRDAPAIFTCICVRSRVWMAEKRVSDVCTYISKTHYLQIVALAEFTRVYVTTRMG